MRTVSLRRRVTLTAAIVSGIALVVVAVVVHGLFAVVVSRSEDTTLTDRVQLARQLAMQKTPPRVLIARVDNRSVRASLVLADGQTYGSLTPRREAENVAKTRRVILTGPGQLNHSRLTVQIDEPLLARIGSRLVWVLVAAIAAALLLIAGGLWFGVRRALAPLDSMTRLARDIAHGHRGSRLSPDRTDTELGRTASAFDEMLDALEGAESRARGSEQQLRAFVGDAAHELRTPVAGIRAIAEAVLHQPADADPEERQRMYLLLAREAQRAGRLVDDLLDMARIDAGLQLHTEPVDLYELSGIQLDRVRMLHPDVEFRLDGRAVRTIADPERIGQILVNILSNACQAMPEGGVVTVRVEARDDLARITIADTGPGIAPDDRERIFDRLVRLDQARETRSGGSGLGLPIARGIARAHGGDLNCTESEDGRGARFVLTLKIT
ncbi:HAMP domain-containing histidine kinase [Nocardia sp. CA2R105]|uniref:sensor histidine kinase n=1 Tax=Nocardia coffeae TaxID=2873381 RepID=UPI001CA62280|nr:HAMP domain-containing sensor histidine kinase [Nocardia coffeae]MBY8862599.1 HAMP domain-containing histidine kinase [Nocardia coffeae]